jgi:hypothetical protein
LQAAVIGFKAKMEWSEKTIDAKIAELDAAIASQHARHIAERVLLEVLLANQIQEMLNANARTQAEKV